jgi:raffinose/stachyose/melibiose transport system permease protein
MFAEYRARTFSRELLFVLGAIVFVFPVYLLIELSLKSDSDVLTSPLSFPTHPKWSNYVSAWNSAGGMGSALLMSLLITACSVGTLVLFGSLAAYAIARHTERMSTAVYVFFIPRCSFRPSWERSRSLRACAISI